MPQVPGIRPFEESDLADQFRCDLAALLHLLRGQRFAPSRGPFLWQISERAMGQFAAP